jgi:hypothetical protein
MSATLQMQRNEKTSDVPSNWRKRKQRRSRETLSRNVSVYLAALFLVL